MLVLSLFPGIGLLDQAFEEEGFCVVRGPDILWGGDIHDFHPSHQRFEGIIGGPPCQAHSRMGRLNSRAVDLIPEFERCVREAEPCWFLMENVPDAPTPSSLSLESGGDYRLQRLTMDNRWVGGVQRRQRSFTFGAHRLRAYFRLEVPDVGPELEEYSPTVLASGSVWNPDAPGQPGRKRGRAERSLSNETFRTNVRLQGLEDGFDLPGFTIEAKIKAVGNGVPLPMGRAIARAVKKAVRLEEAA